MTGPLPLIRCVRAANPSALTGTGTNTYIVGTGEVAVIDPGPDLPDHLAAILATLSPGERITSIFVTHAHQDHSGLARSLARATGAPVRAFVAALPAPPPFLGMLPGGGEGIDRSFAPDIALTDGAVVTGGDWQLIVHHTPGHLHDHVCLAAGDRLFSGDHVMGWSTSVVSPPEGSMAAYRASLARLAAMRWSIFYPGHGDPVADAAGRLADLIAHRAAREAAILQALTGRAHDLASLTDAVYTDVPRALILAARRNTLAHLVELWEKNLVSATVQADCTPTFARC